MKLRSLALNVIFSATITLVLAAQACIVQAAPAAASISRDDPQVMLEQATSALLEISKEARAYVADDRERYYAEVTSVLDQIMDIQYFARGVMATYASARVYKSLQTDAERAAFRDRVARFAVALKRVWMVKYADALLKADGETIKLARVNLGSEAGDRASLEQTITDRNNQTYLVQYSLHEVKEGGWMVANVIVEGINLGETYRSQFAEAVEKNRGDVDYVVDHWVELMLNNASSSDSNGSGSSQ